MILIDTGPIIALFNPQDPLHETAKEILASIKNGKLHTTMPVLTESYYLLRPGSHEARALSSFILKGGAQICPSDPELFSRMCQLMEIYADHPMDLADASLVALAEKIGTKKVLTFDYNDFFAYKIQKGHKYLAIDIIGAKAAR